MTCAAVVHVNMKTSTVLGVTVSHRDRSPDRGHPRHAGAECDYTFIAIHHFLITLHAIILLKTGYLTIALTSFIYYITCAVTQLQRFYRNYAFFIFINIIKYIIEQTYKFISGFNKRIFLFYE